MCVGSGDTRVCLASLESPHSLRTIVAVGAVLPMDRGSAGQVLADGAAVRGPGWAESVEERERGVASVSAPVVVDGCVVAAVSVSGPDRADDPPAGPAVRGRGHGCGPAAGGGAGRGAPSRRAPERRYRRPRWIPAGGAPARKPGRVC